jgi:hypothetical protein
LQDLLRACAMTNIAHSPPLVALYLPLEASRGSS